LSLVLVKRRQYTSSIKNSAKKAVQGKRRFSDGKVVRRKKSRKERKERKGKERKERRKRKEEERKKTKRKKGTMRGLNSTGMIGN